MNNQSTIHLDPPVDDNPRQRSLIRHLPNALTILRILMAPVLYWLIMDAHTYTDYVVLYYLFVFAGLTDVYDGKLARSHKTITTFGKFVDPVADKLILAATLIPFYMLSAKIPILNIVSLEILIILLGRELLITLLRYYSMWSGKVFSASRLAKFKTVFQMFFIGSVLVHLARQNMVIEHPSWAYNWFDPHHYRINQVVILIVVGLSVVSAVEYIARNVPALARQSRT